MDHTPLAATTLLLALAAALLAAAPAAGAPVPGAPAGAAAPAAETPLPGTLRAGHPRVLLTPDSLAALKKDVKDVPAMADIFTALRKEADGLMNRPTVEYKIVGPRLLTQSRNCLSRVSALALVHLLTGEAKYADRALKELEAAAGFKDWNPSHFLDTAEMTCAFGIGYDWLFSHTSDAQKKMIRDALLAKGLEPGLNAYRGKAGYGWWTKAHHNWNQVCNGGLAVGALAIMDEAPDVAGEILRSGLASVPLAMASFGPDGSWNEGPGYWGYTMRYTSYYGAALLTALGPDAARKVTGYAGLAEAGVFRIYFVGPSGMTFNFADAGASAGSAPAMFWLSKTFDRPVYAHFHRQRLDNDPLDLVWHDARGEGPKASGLPPSKHFRKDEIIFMRSDWDDPKALWAGFKGGDNAANHSHLDLGSFVLDAFGRRWAVDLGSDDYNLPAYFGNKRWTYYRLATESHNTLLIDGANQAPRAKAPVVFFAAEEGGARAVVDLTKAYPMTQSVRRGMAMEAGRRIVIRDEVASAQPVEVLWGMVTEADVRLDGASAVLTQGGDRLFARIVEPAGARFETVSANPPPPQRQQPKAKKLVVRLPDKVTSLGLTVVLAVDEKSAADATARPLAEWEKAK
jgi:hypothetical protein